MKEKNLISLDELIKDYYGEIGTPKRNKLERDCESFRIGVLLQEARKNKGLTQEQLAEKVGTSKGYISKLENNINEIRFSTLKKIVEEGLGGNLDIQISF
jgi:Predicted transcriptional regulator with C-terminal CBS domains